MECDCFSSFFVPSKKYVSTDRTDCSIYPKVAAALPPLVTPSRGRMQQRRWPCDRRELLRRELLRKLQSWPIRLPTRYCSRISLGQPLVHNPFLEEPHSSQHVPPAPRPAPRPHTYCASQIKLAQSRLGCVATETACLVVHQPLLSAADHPRGARLASPAWDGNTGDANEAAPAACMGYSEQNFFSRGRSPLRGCETDGGRAGRSKRELEHALPVHDQRVLARADHNC
eukprot:6171987-Pleurochrysis_carterae.AAC.1